MTFDIGYLLLGALLIAVAGLASLVKRLPLTETMIYLTAGVLLGPFGCGWVSLDAIGNAHVLERIAEVAVIVSLFTAGLKLRVPMRDRQWWVPFRLAFASMTITVGLIAVTGVLGLGLPLGAAVLLGAILAPTDPVLASGVQVAHPRDRDRLRFSLTGEAGFNDGTAFPFVMLGLGLLGLHELGAWGWRWWTVDVFWAIGGGLGIGAGCGWAVARLILWLRRRDRGGAGRDEFIALGLIALSYGAALLAHSYGFLAVFAAGLALRAIERERTREHETTDVIAAKGAEEEEENPAPDAPETPAHMAGGVLSFNEQIERLAEVALVLIIGAALSRDYLRVEEVWFIALILLVIRPVAVAIGLLGSRVATAERGLMAWFGIRGIGSLYYLMYALNRGLSPEIAWQLTSLTLTAIVVSIILHGITVTPLMAWYRGRRGARE